MKKWLRISLLNFLLLLFINGVEAQVFDTTGVYPNTFKDTLNVYFELNQPDTVTVTIINRWATYTDSLVQSNLFTPGYYNPSFNLDTLDNGIYFLKITASSGEQDIYRLLKADTLLSNTKIEAEALEVVIYPNPSTGILFTINPSIERITIYDLKGQKVKELLNIGQTIDCSDLPHGTYIFRIKLTTGEERFQLIEMAN
jgi:hypothetical protein